MLTLLWIIHGAEVYGERRAIVSLVTGLKRHGHEVSVLSLENGACVEDLRARGITVTVLEMRGSPGLHLARSKWGKLKEAFKLIRYQWTVMSKILPHMRSGSLIAVHVLNKNVLPAVALAARRSGKLCIWEMTAVVGTGYFMNINRHLHALLIRLLRVHTLPNSLHTARTLGKVSPAPKLMHLSADENIFDPDKVVPISREELGIPSDAVIFMIVARLDPMKGQYRFLEALMNVSARHPEEGTRFHLVLVGGEKASPEGDRIRSLASDSDWQRRVHFITRTAEPERYLAMADVIVNARIDPEPFGLSVIEGMMMGKPVLVHALGGPAETVEDGVSGWHAGEGTVGAFAAAIQRALGDGGKWQEMGSAARARALNLFSQRAQVERYLQILRNH